MPLITRSARANIDANSAMKSPQITAICGEDIDAIAPMYIGADGKWYMSDGTAVNAAAAVDGWAPKAMKAGETLTGYGPGLIMKYGSGLTPGATYYLGATKGRLDSAATPGDNAGVARAIDDTHIRALRFK